ncbi:hypothetical protein R5R35_005998 [Gryllus longicercus]|uniref:Uncharacterized protein n=1 Tax=Gryllus longicercus TaxID=2509291 RepID=A0AAN9VFA7_9ORTH
MLGFLNLGVQECVLFVFVIVQMILFCIRMLAWPQILILYLRIECTFAKCTVGTVSMVLFLVIIVSAKLSLLNFELISHKYYMGKGESIRKVSLLGEDGRKVLYCEMCASMND